MNRLISFKFSNRTAIDNLEISRSNSTNRTTLQITIPTYFESNKALMKIFLNKIKRFKESK